MVRIILFKESPDAIIPKIAYSGSSAAFDITCTETTLIPAKGTAIVPNGKVVHSSERTIFYDISLTVINGIQTQSYMSSWYN